MNLAAINRVKVLVAVCLAIAAPTHAAGTGARPESVAAFLRGGNLPSMGNIGEYLKATGDGLVRGQGIVISSVQSGLQRQQTLD